MTKKLTKIGINPDFQELSSFVHQLPTIFETEGKVIYKGRNELREFDVKGKKLIVKSYQLPHLFNRIIYNFFRDSKAKRSYSYALMLRKLGVGSPVPVGYYSISSWLLFGRSYFVCLKSDCPYTYRDFERMVFPNQEQILRAIARTTALLHENGLLHKDYSAGNILFQTIDNKVEVEIIDLNRMRFGNVDIKAGCKNFERLPGTHEMFAILAEEYAKARGFDAQTCLELIEQAHSLSD